MKDKVDPSYMQKISTKKISWDMEPNESAMEEKVRTSKFKVGEPVWYDWEDQSGWGLVTYIPTLFPYLIHVQTIKGMLSISPFKLSHEKPILQPPNKINHIQFIDDDGDEIDVSYGEYEGDGDPAFIVGIDTPYEAVSFRLNDINKLINALKEVSK